MIAPKNAARREILGNQVLQDIEMPDLVEIQLKSYESFLQISKLKSGETLENIGLEEVFREVFPIKNTKETYILEYVSYYLEFDKVEYSETECVLRGQTYSAPLKIIVTLFSAETGEIRERELYIGDIPLMTERGTFIINGAERVVVSQIHRSPGVVFEWSGGNSTTESLTAKIIPYRGSWLEFEIDNKKNCIWVKIDKYSKVLSTLFLRVLGFDTREKIIEAFYPEKTEIKISVDNTTELLDKVLAERVTIRDKNDDSIVIYQKPAGEKLLHADLDDMIEHNVKSVKIVEGLDINNKADQLLINCFEQEVVLYQEEGELEPSVDTACQVLNTAIKMKDRYDTEKIQSEIKNMFFSKKRYDLGRVGRFKLNKRFNYSHEESGTELFPEDISSTIKFLIALYKGEEKVDDIDHLGNRRVRMVGELIALELKKALVRISQHTRDKLSLKERRNDLRLQDLIAIKPILSVIKDFFGSSQLCQFMDQVNPLAALTHRRRLNALGTGGLSRERAGFDVRDVHYSHYGRVCPIESPEGPNIGLIMSLTNYARINPLGFLETPYRKVVDRKVTDKIEYLTAIEEDFYFIAQADARLDDNKVFIDEDVPARNKGDYISCSVNQVNYMDSSPRQIVSVSTALIPFLEHDDANRALMGSNMQRQAVPLLHPEAPRVGTGMELKAGYDSGVLIRARRSGKVIHVTNQFVEIEPDDQDSNENDIYTLIKYKRTNQDTCFTQKGLVSVGQKIEKGEILADGLATKGGELALGRNILVGFLPWNGYNFEDAIVVSERLVKADAFTSLHIKEFSVEVHETRQGLETVTNDISNVPERLLKKLNDDGIVYIGAKVQSNDILVGKITPKSESEIEPEKKLITHVFGDKGRDVRDTSLRLPNGVEGTVIGVSKQNRASGDVLPPGVEEIITVSIVAKRCLKEGDKMAGRHGNKGVVARIVPEEDMPYMEDGRALDICLSPLGVPSRMNIGQLLEAELGWAGMHLDKWFTTPVFSSPSVGEVEDLLDEAGLPRNSKVVLLDGKTGHPFENPVTVGCLYIMKLHHLVDEKMHARCTGTYSLVTQQPLGGKAQFGGQRLGEMEVWALEAYGAANILNEFITVKSDDLQGRLKIYESIVKGKNYTDSGIPESFRVLMHELRGLGLDISVYNPNGKQVALTERDEEIILKKEQSF